jgi:hypothetical protein
MNCFPDRCGMCKNFPGNVERCPKDTNNRKAIYANDYECEAVEKVTI